jgi:tRNA threonylcarbamoyl adenosine modification protein YjeE
MTPAALVLDNEAATVALALTLSRILKGGEVILLEGPLGAGKTFFSAALLHALGVPADEPVTSPTFALLQEYEARFPIVHGDLYRLSSPEEVLDLGIEERVEEGALALIEWGARFAEELHPDLELTLGFVSDDARSLSCRAFSARGRAILEALWS